MKELILNKFRSIYSVRRREMGELQRLSKGLIRHDLEAYEAEEMGNLFFLQSRVLFGLITIETVVITPFQKDLSFCNMDIIQAPFKCTGLFEMFKTSLREESLDQFSSIREKYADLEDYPTQPRWYDEYRLPSSIAKTGPGVGGQIESMMEDCLDQYLNYLQQAPKCNPQEKRQAVQAYVDQLLSKGGMAVDAMKKMIGTEKTEKLVREAMYGL